LKTELSRYEDIEIAGEAINGDELFAILTSCPADICLLDLHMPKVSGMEVLDLIRCEKIKTNALVISADDEEKNIIRALTAGAKGYFVKGCDIDAMEIYNAISIISSGKFYFNELSASTLLTTQKQPGDVRQNVTFSSIELDIIRYISQEMTTTQIAEITHYKPRSIENIRQELIHRVGARSAVGLVIYALRHGLIGASLYAA
jgi:DNA-binding NarL/FixJ family response regulator